MTRVHWTSIILAIVLAAALSALPVWAEPQAAAEGRPARLAADGAFSQLWSLLIELWSEAGCILDPHGCPGTRSAPKADEGCLIDPYGGGCSR